MNRIVVSSVVAMGFLVGAAGCASAPRFPDRRQIAEVAARPVPAKVFDSKAAPVERFELEGPFPETVGSGRAPAPGALQDLLQSRADGRGGLWLASEGMHCAARQLGRFYLAHQAYPDQHLQDFILGRCGTVAIGFGAWTIHGEVDASMSDDALLAQWGPDVEKMLDRIDPGHQEVGVWLGRADGRAVVAVAAGERRAHVRAIPTVPDAEGHIRVEGELFAEAASVSALTTRGVFRVGECAQDPAVTLPRFAFDCEVDPADETAVITVAAFPPRRVLGKTALEILARPSGAPADVYVPPAVARPRPAGNPEAVGVMFVEGVNEVRREAGLEPLQAAPRQAAVAAELAPRYFAASFGQLEETVSDVIALGMQAGWEVDAPVRKGFFGSSWLPKTNDVSRLVAAMIARPFSRRLLLEPSARRIAVGPVLPEGGQAVAAIVGTYAVFEDDRDHDAMMNQVLRTIIRERKERDLAPPVRLAGADLATRQAAEAVQSGQATPKKAVNGMLSLAVQRLNRPVQGWHLRVSSLDELDLPDEILNLPALGVSASVARYTPEDEPWTQYVVFLVIATPRKAMQKQVALPATAPLARR